MAHMQGEPDERPEASELVETPHGKVMLHITSETVGRAFTGPENGWLVLDGRPLYAYAQLRRRGGSDGWAVSDLYSNVMELDGGRAGPRAGTADRERALQVLRDAFVAWLPTRPDLVAGVALAARRREEREVVERVEGIRADLAKAEAELPALKAAREAAEEEFERATEPAVRPGL